MNDDTMQVLVNRAYDPENAIKILRNLQRQFVGSRANGKNIMSATINAAICRAIMSLEKEINSMSCANNTKLIWARQDVYDRIRNGDEVIIEAVNRDPMIIRKGKVYE